MKITQKGPADADLAQLVNNDKVAAPARRGADPKAQQLGESSKVNISDEARKLQKIAELARKGDELRAEKVEQIKERIAQGEYRVDAEGVAKSMLRSEVARLLEKK